MAPTCDCCGTAIAADEAAIVHNQWEGRLDGYCYDCASQRCDYEPCAYRATL